MSCSQSHLCENLLRCSSHPCFPQLLCSDGVWNSLKECAVLRFVRSKLSAGLCPADVAADLCKREWCCFFHLCGRPDVMYRCGSCACWSCWPSLSPHSSHLSHSHSPLTLRNPHTPNAITIARMPPHPHHSSPSFRSSHLQHSLTILTFFSSFYALTFFSLFDRSSHSPRSSYIPFSLLQQQQQQQQYTKHSVPGAHRERV